MSVMHRDANGYFHPSSEQEIQQLIRRARREGRTIRARGSEHSIAAAIYTAVDGREPLLDTGYNLILDRYRDIRFDDQNQRVTVEAGCHLSVDPEDPTSTTENGLLFQIDQKGWALSDLGGITHQTVSGFVSTGSSGGSTQVSVYQDLVGLRIVDGNGEVHDIDRDVDPDRFHAAVISMGLFGILLTLTFQCIDRYDVIGQEATTSVDDCAIKLFDDGPQGFQAFLETAQYSRLLWWPQKGLRRVQVWQARRMKPEDYEGRTGPDGKLVPKPIDPIPNWQQWAGGIFFRIVGNINRLWILGKAIRFLFGWVFPLVIRLFVTVDKNGPKTFWESWWEGLPMDDIYNYRALPTEFTELFIPISKTAEVMRVLRDHYERNGRAATGSYLCEIYAGKKSEVWLSPSYGEDMIRLDFFWFEKNYGDPTKTYFPQFFDLFAKYGFRLHWGKYLSANPATGPGYLRNQFPRWDDFMRLRETMDQDQIFVTDHWRRHLGIERGS